MDISKLDVVKLSNDGYRCIIKNPKSGEDTDLVIIIKGVFADGFKDDAEQADDVAKNAAFLAKYSVGWENMEENGAAVKFSQAAAERIYAAYPVIRGQVLSAAMDVRNFIKD